MPTYTEDILDKIQELRDLVADGVNPQPFELIKVNWPSPTAPIYYAVMQTDEVAYPAPPVSPIEARLIPDGNPDWFLPINQDSTIGDEEVDLKFWDGPINEDPGTDGAVSDLIVLHGEGIKVEFFYWFPQVELLLSMWEGHLQSGGESDREIEPVTIAQGFRSADSVCPRRAHYSFCQAIFGGQLLSYEEQARHPECNYDLHLGGPIGTNDPDTGLPWTFCPRRNTGDCTARGVNPLRHFSHLTILSTVFAPQSSGGGLFYTSQGNETNLKEAVRVVMGERRVYDMRAIAFLRQPVTSNPDHGFFDAVYEACEGPIEAYVDPYFTVGGERKPRDPIHWSEKLGELGQVALSGVTPHGYSGTALQRYNFGWINPANVDQNDARADAIIRGLRDIRQYIPAGAGLVGEYFGTAEFTNLIARRIDADVNYATTTGAPAPGVPPTSFSVRRTGYITFPATGTWNLIIDHDDSARLEIDGDEIINNINVGIDTGTFDAIADTPYPIIIDHVQGNAAGNHPWRMIMSWEMSGALSPDAVPASAFTHDETYILSRTSNRAWQIARMLTDTRWGFGYDYARLSLESFGESATWGSQYVRFTDSDGTQWEHYRSESNVDLQEKKIQQQIEDMCLAGRFSRPFLFNGLIHIVPLRALAEDELADCPVFTDEGENRNIIIEDEDTGKSTLKWSRTSALDLKNRVECTYDSAANDWLETPAPPVEDEDAQLAAGRVVGDLTKKVETLKESLLGVTSEAHAVKLSYAFLDLGKFDEGGLMNNCRVKFKAWFMDCLEIHPFKVVQVLNTKLQAKFGFTHFRIMKMERNGDLSYNIETQAYPIEYMANFETVITAPTGGGGGGGGGGGCELQFGTVSFADGVLSVPIEPCA